MCPTAVEPASSIEQQLEDAKAFLAEAQDDIQQLQAAGKKAAAAAASTISQLQQELHAAHEHTSQLQQKLAVHMQAEAAAVAQLTTAKQQLSDAKQALVAMQKAMRELQAQQQQQDQQWVTQVEEATGKLAAVKAQHTAGGVVCAVRVPADRTLRLLLPQLLCTHKQWLLLPAGLSATQPRQS